MCNAFAKIGLFVLIYLICPQCLISVDFQPAQYMIHYRFAFEFIYSTRVFFCFVVSYRIIDCVYCYTLEMLCLSQYFEKSW